MVWYVKLKLLYKDTMRMVYWNIMVYMPDGKTVEDNWWANGCQTVRWVIHLNLTSLAEWGMGSHLPWGWAPSPQCSLCMSRDQCTCHLKWGSWTDEQPSLRTPSPDTGLGLQLLLVGCQCQLMDGCLWIPPQGSCDFCKPWWGHGGLLLDCSSIFSLEGAVGTSASLVVMGWPMPWATNRHPVGEPSAFYCSCNCCLVEQVLPAWANWPLPNWRVQQLWKLPHPLRRPVVPLPARVLPHFLSDGMVHWGLVAGPSPPSTGAPWHSWGSDMAGQVGSLGAKPGYRASMNLYFPREGCTSRGV